MSFPGLIKTHDIVGRGWVKVLILRDPGLMGSGLVRDFRLGESSGLVAVWCKSGSMRNSGLVSFPSLMEIPVWPRLSKIAF